MGGKRPHKHKRVRLKKPTLHIWQLILILIPLLFIEATLLRFDDIEKNNLKQAVLDADANADDVGAATKIDDLKNFAFTHTLISSVEKNGDSSIVFGTGPFYLSGQYQRKATQLIAEATAAIGDDSNPNGNVFAAAMAVCKPQAIANGWAWTSQEYISCMTTEINKYPAEDAIDDAIKVNIPSASLYRYDFASPLWAPTASGFVGLVCLFIGLVIFIKFVAWVVIRVAIRVVERG